MTMPNMGGYYEPPDTDEEHNPRCPAYEDEQEVCLCEDIMQSDYEDTQERKFEERRLGL